MEAMPNRKGRRKLAALDRTKPQRDRKAKAVEAHKLTRKEIAARVLRKQTKKR
jgi:hypothetical protein